MSQLEETLKAILPVDRSLEKPVQARLDSLTKPQGSLGRLEQMAMRYCLATGRTRPVLEKKRVVCFAGDHGVAEEGVSAYPKTVTPQMVRNMLAGGAAINVLTRHVNADLVVVDIGVDDALEDAQGLCRKKVKAGTANMAKGSAMTPAEAKAAVEVGIALARQAAADGVHLLGTGEMGIANTTAASALLAGLLKVPPEGLIGRGTGVDDRGMQKKLKVIEKALEVNRARLGDPLGALAAVGGLEIAGICGLILGAAACRIPVAVDGFISTAGAAVAMQMSPAVRDYLFFCHLSEEKGHRAALQKMGVNPILDLGMRLGEGTGAALAMSVIEAAVKIYNQMATFGSAGVSEKDGK